MRNNFSLFPFFILLISALWIGCNSGDSDYGDEYPDEETESTESIMNPNLPTQNMSFEYGTETFTLELPKDRNLNRDFEEADHVFRYTGAQPKDWRARYYDMFLTHEGDQAMVREIERRLKSLLPGATDDELAELTVAFVQGSIDYDWETYHNIDQGTIRYPYETLYDGTGVCADKTILLAKLLVAQGYDVAIFSFERANHMALGLKVPKGFGMYGTDYTFVESTGYAPIGRIPNNFTGGVTLENNPDVVPIKGGGKIFQKIEANRRQEKADEREYGRDFLFLNAEQKKLKKEMTQLEGEMAELKKKLRGCNGTVSQEKFEECKKVEQEHNAKVETFNELVQRFNAINAERNKPAA